MYVGNKQTHSLSYVIVFLLLSFVLSRQTWGLFFPITVWGVILCAIDFIIFIGYFQIYKLSFEFNIKIVLTAVVVLIPTFYNNAALTSANSYLQHIIIYWTIYLVYLYTGKAEADDWITLLRKALIANGIFHSIGVILSSTFSNIYYSYIYPIIIQLGAGESFATTSAGFTLTSSASGLYVSVGVCMLIADCFFSGEKADFKKYIVLAINFVALMMTGKRGMLVCLFVAFYIAFMIYNAHKRYLERIFWVLTILLVVILAIYVISLLNPILTAFITKSVRLSNEGDVTNGRVELWDEAWSVFRSSPLKGKGWRWFMYYDTVSNGMDVHNVFLQLLVEVGIPCAAIFYIFFGYNLNSILKASKIILYNDKNMENLQYDYFVNTYSFLMLEVFMLAYMFEGTVIYAPETLALYLLSASVGEHYRKQYITDGLW